MKIIHKINLSSLLDSHWLTKSTAFIVAFTCLPLTAHAQIYRDNEVKFKFQVPHNELITGTFIIEDYRISSGEDPMGYIKKNDKRSWSGNDGSITYKIGRHGTTDVADWFQKNVSSNKNTFNQNPGKLNFAFIGTLTLEVKSLGINPVEEKLTFNNIAIAQGHAGASNNWWFGGKSCEYTSNNNVECTGTLSSGASVAIEVHRGDGGSHPVNWIKIQKIM